MNLKNEKGITGIDIAISVIILTVFISIITSLFYSINITSTDIERRREATSIAVQKVENLKIVNFEDLQASSRYVENESNENTPYYEEIIVTDYADLPETQGQDIVRDLVKKVTVRISYKVGKDTKNVEISIIRKKEN